MTNYTTGLTASKALKEAGIEVETEKYWQEIMSEYKWTGEFKLAIKNDLPINISNTRVFPSPSLSELSEVFRVLGEKKGWNGSVADWPNSDWTDESNTPKRKYEYLCSLWFDTQSQERCDEFIISLLTQ